jgi:hypothetical protein
MNKWVASAVLVAALVLPAPVPAYAAGDWVKPHTTGSGHLVEVVNKLPGWDVEKAVGFMDGYTASRVKFVARCSGKAWKCLTIRKGTVKGAPVGWRSGSTITIDVAKAKRYGFAGSKQFRRYLVAHEVGHFYGLGHAGGWNLMNPNSKYRGKYLPLKLNAAQVKALSSK